MKSTKRAKCILGSAVALGIFLGIGQGFAQRNEMPVGYPQSLEPALQAPLGQLHEGDRSPGVLVRLAETYFDLADDLLTDKGKRIAAYKAGAKAAKPAFELDESNADAHFFHAVNVGAPNASGASRMRHSPSKKSNTVPCAPSNSTPTMPRLSK